MSRNGEGQESPHWLMIVAFPVSWVFFLFHAVQRGCFSLSRTLTEAQTRGVVTGWSHEDGDGAPVVRYQAGGISYVIQGRVAWSGAWVPPAARSMASSPHRLLAGRRYRGRPQPVDRGVAMRARDHPAGQGGRSQTTTKMDRFYQAILIPSILGLSWLGMQIVHELGHVLAAWAGGEAVYRVVLHPLVISRTDASHERHPLLVIWGGPILGVLLPLAAFGLSELLRSRWSYLVRFFAGFCLVANGIYLGIGSFEEVGDAGDLLRYGAPHWMPIAFGLACVPPGLALWHGLGPRFGLGEAKGWVDRRAALGTLALLLIIMLVEVLADRR